MNACLSELLKMRSRVRRTMVLIMLLLLGTFVLLFVNRRAAIAAGAAACIVRLVIFRRLTVRYQRAYQRASAIYGPGNQLSDLSYSFRETFDAVQLQSARIIPAGIPLRGAVFRNVLKGEKGGARVTWGELSAGYQAPQNNGGYFFVKGTLIDIVLPSNAAGNYLFLSNDLLEGRFSAEQYEALGLERVAFSSDELNRQSVAFIEAGSSNRTIEPHSERYWSDCLASCGPEAAVSTMGNRVTILLGNRFYARMPGVSGAVTEEDLRSGDNREAAQLMRFQALMER